METIKTVMAGFIGIRRKADHERAAPKPGQLILTAVVVVLLFIFTLLAIVRIVLS